MSLSDDIPKRTLAIYPGSSQRLFFFFFVGFILQVFNSVYLVLFTSTRLSYMTMVLFHLLLGFTLTILFVFYTINHLLALRGKRSEKGNRTGIILLSLLILCLGLGIYLSWVGVPRINIWKLYLHELSGFLVLFLMVLHLRKTPLWTMFTSSSWAHLAQKHFLFLLVGITSGTVFLLLSPFITATAKNEEGDPGAFLEETQTLPDLSYDEKSNPFFPSLAATATGQPIQPLSLGGSESCGASGCHMDLYNQWESSAHRHSSFSNPYYSRAVNYMGERVGYPLTKFCGGCHDPLLLFSGKMDDPINTTTWEANAGITCITCHAISRIRDLRGNGSYIIEDPERYPFATSDHPFLQRLNRLLIRVKPGPHRDSFLKGLHREPEFCMVCHKVHIPEQVNGYRWLRGQDEYDAWQDSGVSGYSVRSWYELDPPKKCHDCHMPEVPSDDMGNQKGKIRTHRFPGANTALPAINGDQEQLDLVRDFLTDHRVTLDIVAIKRTTPQGRIPCYIPLESCGADSGEEVIIDVVVRNRGVGHTFPGGTIDSNEVWIEFRLLDHDGKELYQSGGLDEDQYVDPTAHFYKSVLLDRSAQVINKRNVHDWVSTVYSRTIKPGASDVIHYDIQLPKAINFPLTITAQLHYRKFNQWFNNWVFRGEVAPGQDSVRVTRKVDESRWIFNQKTAPELPIITLGSAQVLLSETGTFLSNKDSNNRTNSDTITERLNDYGIALMLQGNFKESVQVFEAAILRNPRNPMLRRNLARAFLKEGNISAAEQELDTLLDLDANDIRARYFFAQVLTRKGLYGEALDSLERVSNAYPNDRKVHNELARLYYLMDRPDQALRSLQEVLKIDPENISAIYRRLLIGVLLDDEGAQTLEDRYLRYKPDEDAKKLSGIYQLLHPIDHRETQLIHYH